MTIKEIVQINNNSLPNTRPIKEAMDIYIPNIITDNIPKRNGSIIALCGSGGSGKTSLLLNMFKSRKYYRGKFDNIYYFCPMSSFLSVKDHPLEGHDKVYHELTVETLENIYNELNEYKENSKSPEYSCIIIDDFANSLKENPIQKQLNKMIIKARHICCTFIFTLQSFKYFPLTLRKQITYAIIFKPKNIAEAISIIEELVHLNKEDAMKLFNYVFNESYAHLDVDTVEGRVYKNFHLLDIKED